MFNIFKIKKENKDMENFIDFYSGEGQNWSGHYINEILDFSNEQLEVIHNYMQWIFPTMEKSKFNENAPVMTEEIVKTFKNNPKCKLNMIKCFRRMLNFYGLKWEDKIVIKNIDYRERSYDWIYVHPHNHMRITRILKSLKLFGFKEEHDAFLKILKEIYKENQNSLRDSYQYWLYS